MCEALTLGNRRPAAKLWLAIVLILLQVSHARATPGDIFTVGPEGARLHEAPRSEAPVAGALEAGQRVIEFERRGDWVRVRPLGTVGREAWLRAAGLERPAPSGAPYPEVEILRGRGAAESDAPAVRRDANGTAFRLDVSGSPALAFAAECELIAGSGESRRYRFEGLVPRQAVFTGSALLCRVRKRDERGRLIVTLFGDGERIARGETRAPFNHVRIQSAGPWGEAAAIRGAIPPRRLELAPGAEGRIVPPFGTGTTPPLSGTITPPLTGTTTAPLRGPITPPLSGRSPGTRGTLEGSRALPGN